jgi:hypothetical protein
MSSSHVLRLTELLLYVRRRILEECRCANLCAGSTSEATVYLGSDHIGGILLAPALLKLVTRTCEDE